MIQEHKLVYNIIGDLFLRSDQDSKLHSGHQTSMLSSTLQRVEREPHAYTYWVGNLWMTRLLIRICTCQTREHLIVYTVYYS